MYVCTYVCMYVYAFVYIYIYIYMHVGHLSPSQQYLSIYLSISLSLYIYIYICGGNTLKSSSCTATDHVSWKLSKLDQPDMWDCWRGKDELITDVLRWTLSHGRAKVGRPARTYIQQLCADTGCGRWTIETGGERGSRRSVLPARHNDDDDDDDPRWSFIFNSTA